MNFASNNNLSSLLSPKFIDRRLYWSQIKEKVNSFNIERLPKPYTGGYNLLCAAVKEGEVEVVSYLLECGARIKSRTGNYNVNTPLHFAAAKGYSDIVETLLNRGLYIDAQNKRKETPLHLAVEVGSIDTVKILLKRGASIDISNELEEAPIYIACRTANYSSNCQEIARLLINNNANLEVKTSEGFTPLRHAVESRNLEVTKLLLDGKVNVNAKISEDGRSPLHIASERGNEEVVKLLLDYGANVDIHDINGELPLHFASRNSYSTYDVIKLLIDKGSNVNALSKDKNTPLHIALSSYGNEKVVKLLLESGANVNIRDKDNNSSFHLAIKRMPSLVKEILKHKPDTDDKSILKAAVCACTSNHGMINTLFEYGFTFDHEDIKSSDLLHVAVEKRYSQIVKYMLEGGADLNLTKNNRTPLSVAIRQGNEEVVKLLLKYGANPNVDSPLHLALKERRLDIVLLLLNNQADFEACFEGYTPLHLAVNNGSKDVVKLLLDRGANVNAISEDGCMPLHFALRYYDRVSKETGTIIIKLLLEHGALVNTPQCDVTPLELAVGSGSQEVTKLLLDRKANPNVTLKNGSTLLHYAVERGIEIVKLLLKHGACVDTHDENRVTPLCLATRKGSLDIVKEILLHEPDKRDKSALKAAVLGRSPGVVYSLFDYGIRFDHEDINDSQLLFAAVENGYWQIVECLLSHGADPNSKKGDGSTLLIKAARGYYPEVVDVLLKYGAKSGSEIHNNATYHAIKKKRGEILKILLDYGAYDKNKPELLHQALKDGWLNGCKILLKHGIDVNARDNLGKTALHYVKSDYEHSRTASYIIRHGGVNLNIQDENGDTALHIASSGECRSIVETLLKEGADVNMTNKIGETPLCDEILFHIIKLKTAGLHVNEKNLAAVKDCHSDDEISSRLQQAAIGCKEELEKLKTRKLSTHSVVSLYDILVAKDPRYLMNKALVHGLESIKHEEFYLYGNIIRNKIKDDRKKLALLDPSTEFFHIFTQKFYKVRLPNEIALMIIFNLESRELENWINCTKELKTIQVLSTPT